ncbi:ParB/RepB/Spo0J family partition protein [Rhodopseudomonas telluris]|uniref:ParB/RepB/Spo0J family partition protein n=1 Tax=Rhodopseudomonas telluris TaxID=644215 RepID=A0ABV6EQL1_9BRAD
MADEHRSRLGRGLASLIGDVGGEAAHVERPRGQRKVPIEFIKANPRNPRRTFTDAELSELSDSIKQHGVIQPIVVRPVKGANDRFEIIAGERRWRAAQRAGLHEVPIVPVEVSDALALEIAIVENVQREDLNPLEEALGYHALANDFKRSQDEIAKIVGKSRSHVANMMRLTKLPEDVQALIAAGDLSMGHARALIGVPDPSAVAKRIVAEGLNVRQTEALAHEEGVPERKPQRPRAAASAKAPKDTDTLALEKRISDALGMKLTIDDHDGAGTVQIRYADLDQLDDIIRRLEAGG